MVVAGVPLQEDASRGGQGRREGDEDQQSDARAARAEVPRRAAEDARRSQGTQCISTQLSWALDVLMFVLFWFSFAYSFAHRRFAIASVEPARRSWLGHHVTRRLSISPNSNKSSLVLQAEKFPKKKQRTK